MCRFLVRSTHSVQTQPSPKSGNTGPCCVITQTELEGLTLWKGLQGKRRDSIIQAHSRSDTFYPKAIIRLAPPSGKLPWQHRAPPPILAALLTINDTMQDTRRGQNNADGFGIGFYTDPKLGDAPCLFTSTIPAWNCTNLQRIASKTASHLIFGHVRATTEGSLSEDNCHPFTHGTLMWMHNGGLGGWKYIKRRLADRLADKWYLGVQGGTDSEWAFALFLDTLERAGHDPSSRPEQGFGPTVLRNAVRQTISIINEMTDSIPEEVIQNEDVDTRSLLNFAVTDGHSVICTRYISSAKDEAASLYYSSGTQWATRTPSPNDREYLMERKDKGADIVLVASEPLTFERGEPDIRVIGKSVG